MGSVKKHLIDEEIKDRIRELPCFICGGEWQHHKEGIFCPESLGGNGATDYFKPDPVVEEDML